jgi:cbb3-type cytochrome oxidase maturation protein
MNESIITLMLGTSVLLGALGLVAFLWGLKGGQFDDGEKMMNLTQFDSEEDLNEAARREAKLKEQKENK